MSRTLFEEAIADAKLLREAAEQNAKNAIIEAVTPKIREFIENQLVGDTSRVEEGDFLRGALSEADEAVEEEEEVALDESALRTLVELFNGGNKASEEPQNDPALAEAFSSLRNDERKRLLSLIQETENTVEVESNSAYEINLDELKAAVKSEIKAPEKTHGVKKMIAKKTNLEEDLYELDEMMDDELAPEPGLDEADLVFTSEELKALGIDAAALKSMSLGVRVDGEEEEGEEVEVEEPAAGEGEEAAPEAEAEGEEGEEGGAAMRETIYEIDENMLRRELARLREAKSKKSTGRTSHAAAAKAFGGGTLEGDALDTEINELDLVKKKMVKEARENRALRQQLSDYRGAVETLREQLSDLNLFNAKLLYVNKILQNKDVAPNQRRSIIEALDGASNLREAKLLYQSLTASITSKNESLNESVRHTAGLASRPVASSSARMSGAGEVNRWAILAGLK